MPLQALLLGDPVRLPFCGQLRLSITRGPAGLALAARVGAGEGPVPAWSAARNLESALRRGLAEASGDRHALLHALWAALGAVPTDGLGDAAGTDLTLLALAWDADGVGVSGVGLAAVWAWRPTALQPLVSPGHPLLAPPGLPDTVPGVLTLDPGVDPLALVGAPSHLPTDAPPLQELPRRCGIRATARGARAGARP